VTSTNSTFSTTLLVCGQYRRYSGTCSTRST
jgi:hypothetical protein